VVFIGVDGRGRLNWRVDRVVNADVRHNVGSEVLVEASEMSGMPRVGEVDEG